MVWTIDLGISCMMSVDGQLSDLTSGTPLLSFDEDTEHGIVCFVFS